MRLDLLVTKGPLVPSNSTICPRNGPKGRQKAPKTCAMRTNTPKPSPGRILGYVAQIRIPRAASPPATPHFLWFPSLRIAQRATKTPVPVVTWWSRRAARPAHGGGQRRVHQGPRGEKFDFFQSCFLDHLGCSNKCFWAILSPSWRVLGHGKSQNALKMGRFGTNNGSKMGQKRVFPKMILDHL